MPGLRRLSAAEAFEITGEWLGCTDGPYSGGGALDALNHCAVSAGEDLGVVKGLQGGPGQHPPIGIAKKSAFGQPSGSFTAGAKQCVGVVWGRFVAELDLSSK